MSVPFSFSDCLLAEIHWTDTPALPGLIIALVVTVGFAGLAAILIRLLDSSGGSDPPAGLSPSEQAAWMRKYKRKSAAKKRAPRVDTGSK